MVRIAFTVLAVALVVGGAFAYQQRSLLVETRVELATASERLEAAETAETAARAAVEGAKKEAAAAENRAAAMREQADGAAAAASEASQSADAAVARAAEAEQAAEDAAAAEAQRAREEAEREAAEARAAADRAAELDRANDIVARGGSCDLGPDGLPVCEEASGVDACGDGPDMEAEACRAEREGRNLTCPGTDHFVRDLSECTPEALFGTDG